MTQEERVLVASLAQALIQTTIDLTFYKRKSGAGEVNTTGHPDYVALIQRFAPLTARLERAITPEGIPEEDLEMLLREVLKVPRMLR